MHSTALTSLGLRVIENCTLVAPVSSTSTVDIVATRLLFGPGLAGRTGFQSIDFGELNHHFSLFIFRRIRLFCLFAGEFPMLRLFAESTVRLIAIRTLESSLNAMLEKELTTWSRAVNYLFI